MSSRVSLDWITASTPIHQFPDDVLPKVDWGKSQHGILHYQLQHISPNCGARFLHSPDVPGRGSCIVVSGQALGALSSSFNISSDALCKTLYQHKFRASRLDFALDIFGAGVGVGWYADMHQRGGLTAPTRSVTYIRSGIGSAQGETLYLGSRESERYLRIYDKGVETGVCAPGEWIRVEIELKQKRAHRAWSAIQTFGASEVGASELSDFMKLDAQFWNDALEGRLAPPPTLGERPITNRRRWLLGQVASAIANEIRDDPTFWETLGTWVGILKSEAK